MYSLHLTSSPWFLLLIPPGLWVLWRQYSGPAGSRRSGRLLFGLQAAALILLAVSLTAPELRRHHVEFHNPAVLILRDQSGSFRGGAELGLGGGYAAFARTLTDTYTARKFDVRVADFAATAWPVSGFGHADRSAPAGEGAQLTSLAAPADFADSAAIPNLQGVFLFSDGVANLDSGRAPRTWRVPIYPVMLPADSIAEIQPVRVSIDLEGGPKGTVEATWKPVGRAGEDPTLRILKGKRTLFTRKLPASGTDGQSAVRAFRFPWTPDKSDLIGREALAASLSPSSPGADFDPWNDTVAVAFAQGRAGKRVFLLRPVRSLDEKGLFGALQAKDGVRLAYFSAEEAGSLALTPADQVWAEAGTVASQPRLAAWLRTMSAKAVIYARAGIDGLAYGDRAPGSNPKVTGLPEGSWTSFTPAAEVKAAKAAADAFPDEVVRLKALTASPLLAPPSPAAGAWVEIREGGKHGLLLGRIDLGEGKRALFFCLPAIWGSLFDPQSDFAVRENISAYAAAVLTLADLDDGAARVRLPSRAVAGVAFDAEIALPEALAASAGSVFGLAGPGFARDWSRPAAAAGDWTIKEIRLPRGNYRAWLRRGADTLWRDSLSAAPWEALELAHLGFDEAALADLAARSGGSLLRPGADPAQVTSMLPTLPAAQIRMERTNAIRLYNTLVECLLIAFLLSLSWYLRKKWDLD